MRPGEVSCAHHGVLFLDELGEFAAAVIDTLRQPLEDRQVRVSRARATAVFPADLLLVAAMNPCPCGDDSGPGSCGCSEAARQRYAARVSGPLLDRFDLRVRLDRPDVTEVLRSADDATLSGDPNRHCESTATVAARVARAREMSAERGYPTNSAIPSNRLDEAVPLSGRGLRLLEMRMRQGALSARGLHRVRRVARTIADLADWAGNVREEDVYCALALRANVLPGPRSTYHYSGPTSDGQEQPGDCIHYGPPHVPGFADSASRDSASRDSGSTAAAAVVGREPWSRAL